MIDPFDVTKYDRSKSELEEFLAFCVFVAGKPAKRTSQNLDKLLNEDGSPFQQIRKWIDDGSFRSKLEKYGFGQYTKLCRAFSELTSSNMNLKTCSVEDLESIYGIGPKTARFFILHSQKGAKVACLDTHILTWMRDQGYDAPRSTPPAGRQYRELEECFLKIAEEKGKTPADLDLEIWSSLTRR